MPEEEILQNLISRLGQSQNDRLPPELDRHFFDVDERDRFALLAQARALAALFRFYPTTDKTQSETWSAFFPDESAGWLDNEDGRVPPHFGLFGSFLELYRYPQQILNTLTGQHLDFQFQRVLQFQPRVAQPDRAHLLLELKKGAAPTVVSTEQTFSGGKDATGVELIYRPVRDVVVNQGAVVDLKSVFRNLSGVHFAPIANSSNGLGAPLDPTQPRWPAFGTADLPLSQIGFALSAPVLRMQEGTRTVTLELQLGSQDSVRHSPAVLAGAFVAYVSGSSGWLGPYALSGNSNGAKTQLLFKLLPSDPAIVDYLANVHGHSFATRSPVVQLLLNPDAKSASASYDNLERLTIRTVQIQVEVDGLTTLELENDFGSLNPKKSFQPFGPQPVVGSRFMIGSTEALSKHLKQLTIKLRWQAAPPKLGDWYTDYADVGRLADGVSARIAYQDERGISTSNNQAIIAGTNDGTSTLQVVTGLLASTPIREGDWVAGLLQSDTQGARDFGRQLMLRSSVLRRDVVSPPDTRSGFITISLIEDFRHAEYRQKILEKAFKRPIDQTVLKEPYTPTVQSIQLSYKAVSDEVNLDDNSEASFANRDLLFFHVGCFGQMREHAYLRAGITDVRDRTVPLLPSYPDEGEFLIGIANVSAGDSVSLLVQVAEGSDDPRFTAKGLSWSVLADNRWRLLTREELLLDTTNLFRTSGLVSLSLPKETTTENTSMPTGLVWLRANIHEQTAGVCQLIRIANNGIEVSFADQHNDAAHLAQALEAGSISKLKTPVAGVKGVSQPFGSFGGQLQESPGLLTRRAAERLRHRNRCVTPWDYERIVLERFPEIHKVKCIPHSDGQSWTAPGNVLLVVIPDLRNQNLLDRMQPRVNRDALFRIKDQAQQLCAMQVVVNAQNPSYQHVQLDFKVRFLPGYSFNVYRQKLNDALLQVLAPWAFAGNRPIEFGGQVYRSVLLNFVEDLPYVDFVTEFKLLSPEGLDPLEDYSEVKAQRPDVILVSVTSHVIREY